uniref:AlNc14C411G11456 protein n=1 Tax=Albugo laibachii Nc14 TaxID=890382 RepID=F0WZ48_9STRA|nr:AlNc14C411G11456 [Albugo laibachii Nc14]|eukprot:CCA26763.1 AlNc14C411G11456 [Albugo laibachii Nc14]
MSVKDASLATLRHNTQREVARRYNIFRRTLDYWIVEEDSIRVFTGHMGSKSLKWGGVQSIAFAEHLLMYMKDQLREEKQPELEQAVASIVVEIISNVIDQIWKEMKTNANEKSNHARSSEQAIQTSEVKETADDEHEIAEKREVVMAKIED